MSNLPKYFYYLNVGPYPITVVYAPNERAFQRALKKFKVKHEVDDGSYPTSDGRVTPYSVDDREEGAKNLLCIVTLNLDLDVTAEQLAGIAAHESVHIFQILAKEIGERDPCWEFEAYTVQAVTQDILFAIKDYRKACRK